MSADRSTVRVSHLDVMHSRTRITSIIGPVRLPDDHVIADRLRVMAAAGPHARLGLRPSTRSNRWEFDADAHRPTVTRIDPPASPLDLYDLPTDTDLPADRRPTSVVLAGDYVRTDHNHGLGEVALALTMHGVILGTIDPSDTAVWQPSRRRGNGIGTAVARTYGSDPRRAWALRSSLRRAAASPASVPEIPWAPARAASVSTMPTSTVAGLRVWRDERDPGTSMFAVFASVLHRSLTAAGVPIDPTATVTLDARRYLPKGRVPLGNFVSGLEFDLGDAPTPATIHRATADAMSSGRPVANLALNATRTRLGLRAGSDGTHPTARSREPRARLLFSSIGAVPRHGTIPWLGTADPFYVAHNDPTGPNGITLTWAIVGGAVTTTASFHGNTFDRAAIQDGLDRAASDPLGLLP
ncbi:hypothetical protein ACFYVR_20040 [Rhodococcus sp. NPDC003318]|uniref:hypothetical protein n=1 Tax=Rhodococcus sp. NPDC003318 TaxID=3364503 RepID=UPI0036819047